MGTVDFLYARRFHKKHMIENSARSVMRPERPPRRLFKQKFPSQLYTYTSKPHDIWTRRMNFTYARE